jgi:nitrogen regulatory protein PII
MIVAAQDVVQSILSAISAMPILSEPGGGIIYSMNVEEFITLGK